MQDLQRAAGLDYAAPALNMPVLVTHIRNARSQLRDLQKKHVEFRKNHLQSLAESRLTHKLPGKMTSLSGEKRDIKIGKEVRRIRRHEAIKHIHQKV